MPDDQSTPGTNDHGILQVTSVNSFQVHLSKSSILPVSSIVHISDI